MSDKDELRDRLEEIIIRINAGYTGGPFWDLDESEDDEADDE